MISNFRTASLKNNTLGQGRHQSTSNRGGTPRENLWRKNSGFGGDYDWQWLQVFQEHWHQSCLHQERDEA